MTKLILCTHTVFMLCLLSEIRKETVHISTDVFTLSRCSQADRRRVQQERTSRNLPEWPVGDSVWHTPDWPRCMCHLSTAWPGVWPFLLRLYCYECMVQLLITCLLVYSEIGTALQHSYFGPGSGLFHYERLGCRGNENSLLECRGRKFVSGDCNHGNEAGVVCAAPAGETGFFILIFLKPYAD